MLPPDAPYGLRTGGTVDTAQLEPLRALCMASARVELTTPRTVMESIRLTRVGPAEIARYRDGISLNAPMIRVLDAVGLFDRSAPPAEGTEGRGTSVTIDLPVRRAALAAPPAPAAATETAAALPR